MESNTNWPIINFVRLRRGFVRLCSTWLPRHISAVVALGAEIGVAKHNFNAVGLSSAHVD